MAEPDGLSASAILARADDALVAFTRRSMRPAGGLATPFVALGGRLLSGRDDAHARALATGLARLGEAVAAAFPENLFWDFDALGARLASRPTDEMSAAFDDLVDLHRLFGRATSIRFRYVHDFLYGYDWAKWVARDSDARASIGPYDRRFFAAMLSRGEELIELIAENDAKYHRLEDARSRNPFPFSREPSDELRLHRALAARGAIPVEAWRVDADPRWDVDYYAARERCARSLSLARAPAAP